MKIQDLITTPLRRGDLLGDYQVLTLLGYSPIGTTYHVIHPTIGKEFALKTLSRPPALPLEWFDTLEAQTTLLGKLTHANIDRIIGSGHVEDIWFCIKDFYHDEKGSSCNLDTYMQQHNGRLSPYQTFHILKNVLQALIYALEYEDAHHHNICHGNLKPSNILLSHTAAVESVHHHKKVHLPFEVYVSDFHPYGLPDTEKVQELYSHWSRQISRPLHHKEKEQKKKLISIYRQYDYMAPEYSLGSSPTPQSDVYSLGVLAYEMLTGVVPCASFPPPSEIHSDIPSYWDELLHTCLHSEISQRYPSALELYRDLIDKAYDIAAEDISSPEPSSTSIASGSSSRERTSLTPPGMVYIPAGTFYVGSAECGEDALPQHECSTEGFYIDRTPVTNARFARFIKETGYITEAEERESGTIWSEGRWRMTPGISWKNPFGERVPTDFDDHPVIHITYADAEAYAEWCGRRLPTEQEWEYAARGGQKNIRYPWGDTITKAYANYASDSTCAVMNYQANGYGLYDMVGNVWEWTSCWYEAYPGNMTSSPHFGEKYKVVKGGAWLYDAAHALISYRNANQPDRCYPTLGFRTVCNFEYGV
jgi:formylglycine-generating enzyme